MLYLVVFGLCTRTQLEGLGRCLIRKWRSINAYDPQTDDSEKHPQSPSTLETLAIFIILVWGAIAYYMGLSPIVGTFAAGM